MLFLMILMAGYRIRLPFLLGEIGPAMSAPVTDGRLTHPQGVTTEIKMVLQTDNPRQPLQLQSQQLLQRNSVQALEGQTSQGETMHHLQRQYSGVETLHLEKQTSRMETQNGAPLELQDSRVESRPFEPIPPEPLELRATLEEQISGAKELRSLIQAN